MSNRSSDYFLSQVIDRIGARRISAVTSDSASNVKACRAQLTEKYPWILNCSDPLHQLNLFMKDVMKLSVFKEVSVQTVHAV